MSCIFNIRRSPTMDHSVPEYKVTWEEQDSPSSPSKCDKIIIHLMRLTSTGEEQLVTITVYLTTGRIQVQGKKFEEWSEFEFPVLLNIVKTLNDQQPRPTQFDNSSLFGSSLHNFFPISFSLSEMTMFLHQTQRKRTVMTNPLKC